MEEEAYYVVANRYKVWARHTPVGVIFLRVVDTRLNLDLSDGTIYGGDCIHETLEMLLSNASKAAVEDARAEAYRERYRSAIMDAYRKEPGRISDMFRTDYGTCRLDDESELEWMEDAAYRDADNSRYDAVMPELAEEVWQQVLADVTDVWGEADMQELWDECAGQHPDDEDEEEEP